MGALIPIIKNQIGLILGSQGLLHLLSCNSAYICKDWSSISCDAFTSFQISPLNSENLIPLVEEMTNWRITIDQTCNTKYIIHTSRYTDPIGKF